MQRAAAGTDGFVTALIPAQKLITTTGDELLIKDKKILRSGSAVSSSGTGSTGKSVSYAIPAGDTANGDKGNVNFNLEYLPFNLDAGAWSGRTSVYFPDLDSQGPVWIIRNGTNDLAQNTDTDFVNFGKNGSNGNGAVRWEVKIQPGVPVDSDLRVYDGRFIDTREPNFPIIDFKTDGYSGKAEVWYSVGPTGYQMPAPVLFVWIDSVVVGGPYSKIIPVSSNLVNYGYDIYVIITKDGKISAPELIRSSQGSAAIDYIWGIDLTGAVTPPETGNSPDGNFYPPADSEYTGESINWSPADNPFEANTPYTATVTLTAEEGYTFPDSEDLVIHDGAAVSISSNTGDTITVEISFPATSGSSTTVTDTALGGILFPCAGDTGNTAFPSSSSQYTGSEVSWYKGASPANGAFAAGDAYTAQVTLTAEDGYTFTGVGAFTFSGAAVTTSSNTGSTITVRITFPPAPARVSALDLSQALSPPKTGRYPDVDIASYEYEAPKVEWYYNNGQPFPLTAPFGSKGNYDYSVLFVLTANDGFTFNGLDNDFTYGSSDTVTVQIMHNSGDTVLGRVYFPLPNPWF
jgi:hypothetical protein